MKKWFRRLLKTILVILVLCVLGYYPLVLHSPEPGDAPYVLDIETVRTLARQPGVQPYQLRLEKVGEFQFTESMVMAGEPWRATSQPVYSYQLVYPGKSIIVDTALASMDAVPSVFSVGFDDAAYARMSAAMEKAETIVITHEHFDHIDGLLKHPNLKQILPAVKLTPEQLKHTDRMLPSTLPDGVFDDYQPLAYEGLYPLAAGVVLIKAPGHTPGSQMVYVRLADGREVLLMGDVSWQMRNIEAVRERPLFMTAIIRENRQQVINQFQTLHELRENYPEITLIPGHDGAVVKAAVESGVLTPGFR